MPCFYPQHGFRGAGGSFVQTKAKSPTGVPMTIPCGYCIGCRLGKARDWRIRCTLEAAMNEDNCFLTLTYSDEQLPEDYSISNRHFQLFMKRLRRFAKKRVSYYACGEYGDTTLRPHYHVCLFGFDFADKVPEKATERGDVLYTSETLQRLWADDQDQTRGHCWLANFTPETAGYVARYTMKKISGPPARDHYVREHPITKEVHQVQPETSYMSKRPGIGARWFEKFETDCFPSDFLVIDGQKNPIPQYFSRRLKSRVTSEPERLRETTELTPIQAKRKERAQQPEQKWNNTKERLAVREECTEARISKLKRL